MFELPKLFARRPETFKFLQHLLTYTDCAIYGGTLRDLLLGGVDAVQNDIDIVTQCDSEKLFAIISDFYGVEMEREREIFDKNDTCFITMGAGGVQTIDSRGMFGGFKLRLEGDAVDIWAFEKTLELGSFGSYADPWQKLADRTDFSCNCIAFVMSSNPAVMGTLKTTPGYFETLEAGLIDLNNETSVPRQGESGPNLLAARAVKQMTAKRLHPTPKLAKFIMSCLGVSL